jgi:hypothetical protein
MNRIDINTFERNSDFYSRLDLLLTVKSFDLQAIRKRYIASKVNKVSGSTKRRDIATGGVISLSIHNGKILNQDIICKLKEPRGIDFLDNKLAISSENKVHVISDKLSTIHNPFFSFIHTVSFSPFSNDRLLISSSGFDCIFEYDLIDNTKVWEWFAWENGFDKGRDVYSDSDVYLTRDKSLADKWKTEGKNFLLINDPATQSLPTAQRSAFINSVSYHQDDKELLLATLFHKGVLLLINRNNLVNEAIVKDMNHPHGGKMSNQFCLVTSTNSGEVVLITNEEENRYFFNNLDGKPFELGEMEWLQNSIIIDDFIITIDSNRTAFVIFNPIEKKYDIIPYDNNWAIQDLVIGEVDYNQKALLIQSSQST